MIATEGPDVTKSDGQPHLRIRPVSGWQALNLVQVWQYRDLLVTLAARDVRLRYKQTALGVVWVVLQPLMAAGILSFVLGTIARMPSDGPLFLVTYASMLGWNAFSGTLAKASSCLVGNAHLISKVYFPRLILPLSTVLSSLLDFAVALAMMFVLLAIYGVPIGLSFLLLPIWLALILLLAIGAGLIMAALTVTYRDVQYMLPVALQLLMYGSPVLYTVSRVPDQFQAIFNINPLASVMECFRWSLVGGNPVSLAHISYAALTGLTIFVLGAFAFKRMESSFADVI